MFTIKVINREMSLAGYEVDIVRLYEGHNISTFLQDFTRDDKTTYQVYVLSFQIADGTRISIDTGRVFIMNSAGKTVESFTLKRPD